MNRDRFETGLDRLISVHDRKLCAEIDAGACRTSYDYTRMQRARDAYDEARDAFLDEVFAPPALAPPAACVVVAREEREREGTRGRPPLWRRWIEIRITSRGVTYTFTANASFLAVDGGEPEIQGPSFLPLGAGHGIRFRGVDYKTDEDGPPELIEMALESCRTVALRLHQVGLGLGAMVRPWPPSQPAFAAIVKGEVSREDAA